MKVGDLVSTRKNLVKDHSYQGKRFWEIMRLTEPERIIQYDVEKQWYRLENGRWYTSMMLKLIDSPWDTKAEQKEELRREQNERTTEGGKKRATGRNRKTDSSSSCQS